MITTNGHTDYVIFSDTNCGIDDKISKEYDIKLISEPLRVGETDYFPYSDGEPFDFDSFFENLRRADRIYTWKITAEGYKKYFRPFLKEGKDVLYIHFSRFGTNTFDVDLPMAIKELRGEFSKRKIVAYDSRSVAQGSVPWVIGAAAMRLAGATMKQVEDFLSKSIGKRVVYFVPKNLTYLAKYGKVGGVSAFVGNTLDIRPIMKVDTSGTIRVAAKFMGGDMALSKKIMSMLEKEGCPEDGIVEVGYTDSEERAEKFAKCFSSMAKKMGKGPFDCKISRIDPLHGGIIGPGAVGLGYTLKDV